MSESTISVADFAAMHGLHKQHVFKIINRLGINQTKKRGNRGQSTSYISNEDSQTILENVSKKTKIQTQRDSVSEASLYDIGIFYLIQLEPEYDPNRIKLGFANDLDERLRKHRCSAPYAKVLKFWQCRRLWEKTVIECVTSDCERLHTEVFRAVSLEGVIAKCSQFFDLIRLCDLF